MRSDDTVKPKVKHLKVEKPRVTAPVLWTPWGPQTFAERDAQMDGVRRPIRKVEKRDHPRKLAPA